MSSFVAEKHAKELPVECQEVPLELLGSSAYGRKFQLQEAGVSDWDCHWALAQFQWEQGFLWE